MKEIAVYEAKTRLSELLADVQQGEQFTITRCGVAVARLIGAEVGSTARARNQSQRQRVGAAFDALAVLRHGVSLDIPLRDAIEQGRD